MSKLSKKQRLARIMNGFSVNPMQRVNNLADELNVTTETIRRDFDELDKLGKIKRVYGGGLLVRNSEPALAERLKINVKSRQNMALSAVRKVTGTDTLLLGGGASVMHFAKMLRESDVGYTVITPAYSIAIEIAQNTRISVKCLAGILNNQEGIVHGPETISDIEKLHVPIAVIGASGINGEGISEANMEAAMVYQAIVNNSERVIILADESKLNKRSLCLVSNWGEKFTIITDAQPDPSLSKSLADYGVEVIVA